MTTETSSTRYFLINYIFDDCCEDRVCDDNDIKTPNKSNLNWSRIWEINETWLIYFERILEGCAVRFSFYTAHCVAPKIS